MTMRVLFNGVVLVKPGGATRVDASGFNSASLAGVGVIGMVGEADSGEPNAISIFTRSDAMARYYRGGALAIAAAPAFRASGDARIQAGAQQVVALKANQSARAAKTLQGSGVAQATLTGTVNTPVNLFANGGTGPGSLAIAVDGNVAGSGASFAATQGMKTGSAGSFAIAASETLVVSINGGPNQTITFGSSEATVAAYVQTINNQIHGASVIVSTSQIRIISDKYGTASSVNVISQSGSLAAKTGLSAGSSSGTGNVADAEAVTFAEFKSLVEGVYGVTVTGATGGPVTITSDLSGAGSELEVSAGSVQAAFGLSTADFTASSPVNVLTLTAVEWGTQGNLVSTQVSDSGGGKVIEFTTLDNMISKTETSPVLGAVGKILVEYTGDGSAAVLTINATGLTTTLTAQTDDSLDLTVPFNVYKTIQDVINYINAQPGYSAEALTVNPFAELSADLDYVVNVDITSPLSVYGKLMDVVNWVNQNSSLVTAVRVANGPAAPLPINKSFLTGGTRGTSTNSNWQSQFNLLGTVRVNQVVPLISYDLSADGFGSTATVDSVNAQADAHATYYSSTAGKSERQAYLSKRGSKTQVKAFAQTLNSFNSCMCGVQRPVILSEDGSLTEYPEYIQAVCAASMRSGADLGEPLTFKFVKYFDLKTDASWNPALDANEMILAGVMFVEQVPGQGFRWVKGVTTYTRTDNDAYTEESVVQGWKNVAYELRTYLENLFTGTRATPSNITRVREQAQNKLDLLKKAGQIVDSVLADGSTLNAWRNLDVHTVPQMPDVVAIDVTVSPVSGINFTLNTLTLVPAQISA